MAIHTIETAEGFTAAITENKVAVIDFFALWCGDCKMIDPFFNKYVQEERYKHVYFGKIDVDILNDVSKEAGVRNMPTFQVYKDGKKIDQIHEPKPPQLTAFFEKYLL